MEAAEEAKLTLQRLVGKVALLLTFIYILFLLGGVMTLARGRDVSPFTWPLFVLPATAFVPAVLFAVKLHQTSDPVKLKDLWKRCAVYAITGFALLLAMAFSLIELNG
ncbi:hypothetical protein [Actinoplanes regularis]|uniref:Transmembrane protein n=1 Tax=Actinoplanes regularis TaxID=52697 RepID=A0A239F4C8_9ACTN|nr:hypothetical protein [Actinoplanes regularis]GIE89969.1 hypothetical protein Are01nite_64490 [Actinoplanes regularis]SNS51749.1 hypothetical protein SAMN06264365_11779 [Actinoplanes regularis]